MEEKNAAIITREGNNLKIKIREALEILCQSPTLSRDRGFELPDLSLIDFARDKKIPIIFT